MNRYLVHLWCGNIHAATYVNAFCAGLAGLVARDALAYGEKWWISGRPDIRHDGSCMIHLLHGDVRAYLFVPVSSVLEAVAEAERVLQAGHRWEERDAISEQGVPRRLKDESRHFRGLRRTPHDWGPYNRLLVNAQNG